MNIGFSILLGFHKNCSALRERERERERENYVVMEKNVMEKKLVEMPGIEPGAFHVQSERCTTELTAILEDRAFKKYYIHLFTVAHYFVVIRAE